MLDIPSLGGKMRSAIRYISWLVISTLVLISNILIHPFKHTKIGKKIERFLDKVDLFSFNIREAGVIEAIRFWRYLRYGE
jgi:hypothetical protein